MDSLKVVTLKSHSYWGKRRQQGDEYYVDNEKDLKFLLAIKKVKRVDPKLKKPFTPPGAPQPVKGKAKKKTASKSGNSYQRKDLQAAPAEKVEEKKPDADNKKN